MVRSLWTAAAGMTSQQTNVDTISNNLANVNTTGYKMETTHFKSLLYQQLQAKTTSANGETKPVNAQVGLGSRVSAVTSQYVQGSVNKTDSDTDFAIVGNGIVVTNNAAVMTQLITLFFVFFISSPPFPYTSFIF